MKRFGRTAIEQLNPLATLRPKSTSSSTSSSTRGRAKRLRLSLAKVMLTLTGLTLVGGVSGANWATAYVRAELAPKISVALSQAIERPIQLGDVEQVTWSGLRLGRSLLPATATDADQITVEAIEISFDPLQAARNKQLRLTVTLIRPTAYIDQEKSGDWLNLDLKFAPDAPIEIEQIRLRDATVTLAPQPITLNSEPLDLGEVWEISDHPTQLMLHRVNGHFSLQEQGNRLRFDMTAQLEAAQSQAGKQRQGRVQLKGDMQFAQQQIQLAVVTKALPIQALATFVPTDLKLDGGWLTANFEVQIKGDRPQVIGWARLQEAALRAKGEPNSFTGINGRLQFEGESAALTEAALRFGQIPFQLDGKIHFQDGFDLNARVPQVDAAPLMQTLKLKVPFPVEGTFVSDDLRLTGALDHPVLSGTAKVAKPLRLDRLTIAETFGQFRLSLAEDHLLIDEVRLQPVTGGTIAARAEIWLETDNGEVQIDVKDIPTDALAHLYQLNLNLNLSDDAFGLLNASAKVNLVAEQPSLIANWQLQGDYPAQGEVTFAKDTLRLQSGVQVGDGQLNAQAAFNQEQWQATLTSSQIPLHHFTDLPGQLNGNVNFSGSTRDLTNFSLNKIQAQAAASVQLDQGTVAADLQAAKGQWQAQLTGTQVPLSKFTPGLPGHIDADVRLNGLLNQLNIANTKAEATLQLSESIEFFSKPLAAQLAWNGEKLHVKQARSGDVKINGSVTPTFTQTKITGVEQLDLNVEIKDYDLATLSLVKTTPIEVAGIFDLTGTVKGTLESPQINGQVQLDRLAIQDFRFDPLQGAIRSSDQPDQSLRLDLQSHSAQSSDRIMLTLDSAYRPTEFSVQLDQATAAGQLFNNRLLAQIRNFSLDRLKFMPAGTDLGEVRGTLNASLAADLPPPMPTQTASSQPASQPASHPPSLQQIAATALIQIEQPGLGQINAPDNAAHQTDRFSGIATYRDGIAALTDGVLQLGNSQFTVTGQSQPQTADWQAQVTTAEGNFADLLGLVSPEKLIALLKRHGAVHSNMTLPASGQLAGLTPPTLQDLTRLKGTFSGTATLQSSAQGMAAQFDLAGQDWQIADYRIRQLRVANAQFNGESWMLPAVEAEGFSFVLAGLPQQFDARFRFAGLVSPTELNGQLQLDGVALSWLQTAFNLPIQLNGNINASAMLTGSLGQPNLTGELHLQGVRVRDVAIQEAKVGFSYIDQQLHLESWQSLTDSLAQMQEEP